MDISPFYLFAGATVVLLVLELAVFQLSVFWFLFAALGAAITAAVCWFYPDLSWTAAIATFVVGTVAVLLVLLPWFRRMRGSHDMAGNDAVGQRVSVLTDMAPGATGRVSWSGRDWDAVLTPTAADALASGDEAQIESVEGIRLQVRPIQ